MGFFENRSGLSKGLALGIGSLLLAPPLVSAIGEIAKPVAKATIKGSILLVLRGRRMIAEAAETVEDLAAEAKAELIAERFAPGAAKAQTYKQTG